MPHDDVFRCNRSGGKPHRRENRQTLNSKIACELHNPLTRLVLTSDADGGWYVGGGVRIVERIGFSAQTESWLSFYPRRWVGWLGFTAITVILFCVVFSLFFPRALASAEIWHDTPPRIELH